MAPAMTLIPETDPLRIAWEQYTKTEEHSNAKNWAAHPEHLEGSLWTLFIAGWLARSVHAGACTWTEDEDGNWSTACGSEWVLEAGTPTENQYRFCSTCGLSMVEKRYEGKDD